ncbi:hypothetical protein I5M32_11330 [Pedobacter sp. SD-b]|uniref:NrS-1 polymerase-like helicase domain-containing protein n=1 Tax=Pedobacter segetis TaxID=2793069 RepID=A0ABS1BKZ0_9SPHI|nr:DUF5906 domain-containing protein [Pedobacter segetis]MBK0383549.1 hypothetical protein [Pedobacter segetis]
MAKKSTETPAPITEVQASYFQDRLQYLGVDPVKYCFAKTPYFTENKNGNIEIHYPTLHQAPAMIKTRLHPDNVKENYTYFQSQKGNFLFFPPNVLQAFTDKTPIETLYLTIGEFKATSADVNGLHCVGLSNKNAFANGENLHPDLVKIIEEMEVQNLVLLLDADIYHLEWDAAEEPDKDLAANLYQQFNAVSKFRLLAKEKVKSVYLSVIRERLFKNQDVKGLDDLFNYKKATEFQVIEDLQRFTVAKSYFETINLSIENISKLKSFFHINFFKGSPDDFYRKYSYLIGGLEFTFLRGKFKWDIVFERLELTKHADSGLYKRVGCDFFKIIHVPNSKKILERKLIGWKPGEINRDYVQGLGIKNFFNTIDKYEDFCNVPENNPEKYEQIIEGCYNLYFPLEHVPEVGTFPKTEAYLKHIFGEKQLISCYTNYDLALDWLTVLYREPIRKLPAICLVSKEKRTGKSTFLFWLRDIFNENATIIGNNEINDKFNDDYIGKLIIAIDESFIEKKLIQESIKSQITNEKGKMQGKYTSRRDIPFIAKYVMTSNDETNFMKIDDDEERFWINRVNPFPVGTEVPDLREEMKPEIPAFLNLLKTRKILHPYKSRLYFDPKLLETDATKAVKNSSKGWLEKEIRAIFKDKFFEHRYHTLYFSSSEVLAMLNGNDGGIKFRRDPVTEELEKTFKMSNDSVIRVSQPAKTDNPTTEEETLQETFEPKKGRFFTFKIEDFYSWDYIEKYFKFCPIEDIKKFRLQRGQTESKEDLML